MDSAHTERISDKLNSVLICGQRFHSERDCAALFQLVAKEARRIMEADLASIFLLDREKNELWSIVTLDGKQIRFDARLGIAGAVTLTGQVVNVTDAAHDPRFYRDIDTRTGYRTKSLLAVPLRNREGVILGAFEVLNKKHGAFTATDEQLMEALASQAATALETAQIVDALKRQRDHLIEETQHLRKEVEGRFATQSIIGTSPKMQRIVRLVEQISDSSVNVLITGESGTGKELIAKAIHFNSPRAAQPLVCLNCAALPETLVESELFGIEKGVATGVEARIGKFEAAHGGTLFLDEIGDLSLVAQAKILRALQEKVIERVGGRKSIAVDARIVAATNKDLEAEIQKGTFRADLYYRLAVIHIRTPSLREIPEDIPLLAGYFLEKYCREMRREPAKLSSDAVRWLVTHPRPGNVRQLENDIKRLVVLTRRPVISEQELVEALGESQSSEHRPAARIGRSLKESVTAFEKEIIQETLKACGRNQVQAAKALALSRQGLIKKMKRYGIK
jgi:Nif-specific regulatory protein